MSVGKASIKRVSAGNSGKKETVAPLATEEKAVETAAPVPEKTETAGETVKEKKPTRKTKSAVKTEKTAQKTGEKVAEKTEKKTAEKARERETAKTFVQVTDEMPYYLL